MATRREDIDDFEVWWNYEQEGWTLQEIADLYGVSVNCVYFRLHPEKQKENNQTEKSKEAKKQYKQTKEGKSATKKYNQSNKAKAVRKKYSQTDKGKLLIKKAVRRYQQTERGKDVSNRASVKYSQTDKGKERTKRFWHSENGKALRRKVNAERRELGSIELNKPFDGSEGHHMDTEHIMHIPKEVHKSIWHNVWTGQGMKEINSISFQYISEKTCDKLIAGET